MWPTNPPSRHDLACTNYARFLDKLQVRQVLVLASMLLTCLCVGLLHFDIVSSGTFRVSSPSKPNNVLLSTIDYVKAHCSPVHPAIESLVQSYIDLAFQHRPVLDISTLTPYTSQLIIVHNTKVYVHPTFDASGMNRAYFLYLSELASYVQLPNMVLRVQPKDSPVLAEEDPTSPPVFSFCRTPGYRDLLLPYGFSYGTPCYPCKEGHFSCYVANGFDFGPNDMRRTSAFVRFGLGGNGGWPKGRGYLLELSLAQPHLVDAGLVASSEQDWQVLRHHNLTKYVKDELLFADQAHTYKYLLHVPGNCASHRMQCYLVSSSVILKVDSDEMEWYYPLLKPYVHFLPLSFNGTYMNISEQVAWAQANPSAAYKIVQQAQAAAKQYSTLDGQNCYVVKLLTKYSERLTGKLTLAVVTSLQSGNTSQLTISL